MIRIIIIIAGLAILTLIFLRRYFIVEKGTNLKDLLFRKKNLFHHDAAPQAFELTVDEMIPQRDESDTKKLAKADSYLKKAEIQLQKGDLFAAEQFLIRALSFDPSLVGAYKHLGMIYLQQNQFSKAESIYRKLISTITDDPLYFSNLGMALYSQNKLEEAKNFYKKAIELDASRAGRFFSLAQILYQLNEFEEALDNIKKAIRLDAKNLEYLLTLAHFYKDQDMVPEAKELLSDILQSFPENGEVMDMLKDLDK